MIEAVFIICMTLICLRLLSSIDKQKDLEIARLKKEIKRLGGNYYEQRNSNNQQSKTVFNTDRK